MGGIVKFKDVGTQFPLSCSSTSTQTSTDISTKPVNSLPTTTSQHVQLPTPSQLQTNYIPSMIITTGQLPPAHQLQTNFIPTNYPNHHNSSQTFAPISYNYTSDPFSIPTPNPIQASNCPDTFNVYPTYSIPIFEGYATPEDMGYIPTTTNNDADEFTR